jgi:uncharacterized protein YqgV (UPF0045/DUF77 family)
MQVYKTRKANIRIMHTTDKLNCLDNKLHQIFASIKKLSDNMDASDESNAQTAVIDEPIHSLDETDINIRLEQSITALGHSIDEVIQVIDKSRQDAGKSKQVEHKLTDIMISLRRIVYKTRYSTPDAQLLRQLKQSIDDLTHAARQPTKMTDASALNQSQCSH